VGDGSTIYCFVYPAVNLGDVLMFVFLTTIFLDASLIRHIQI
jgi:hypothetical protein